MRAFGWRRGGPICEDVRFGEPEQATMGLRDAGHIAKRLAASLVEAIDTVSLGPIDDDKVSRGGRLGEPISICARKWNGGAGCLKAQLGPCAHAGFGLHHFLARNHFADHQTCAKGGHQIAERQIGDPRHRGEQNRRGETRQGPGVIGMHVRCLILTQTPPA